MDQRLADELKAAQIARDSLRTQVLKSLKTSLQYETINAKTDLDNQQQLQVVQREIKKRREAVEMYDKAGRNEQAAQEKQEINVLSEFLPKQLSEDELATHTQSAITQTSASSMADMGKVMAIVKPQVVGRADPKKVAQTVKDLLSA